MQQRLPVVCGVPGSLHDPNCLLDVPRVWLRVAWLGILTSRRLRSSRSVKT